MLFHAGRDRQVLVVFEWQGPAGPHRCQGTWKDPSGRPVFTSEAEVDSRGPRFGVYWGLSLPDTVSTGTWVVEAQVDGEPAGVHAFQILADSDEAGSEGANAPARRALTMAELYRTGLESTLTLEVLDASGGHLPPASGFFLTPVLVSTSFAGINASRAVRTVTADGRRLETNEVVAWNQHDDWAILRFPDARGRPVARASEPPRVGDRCYFLDAQGDDERVIVETTFVGRSADGDLRLAELASPASHGAPVFNEYGEVVATVAASEVVGAGPLDLFAVNDATSRVRGSRARAPVGVPKEGAASRTLQELEQAGVFVRPLVRTPHFVSGVLGTDIEQQGQVPVAADQRFRFSRGDRQCVVFLTWVPARKENTTGLFELYDADNRRLGATQRAKMQLRSGKSFVQYWKIPLDSLKPGLYRVDVVLGQDPVWRTFFRLVE